MLVYKYVSHVYLTHMLFSFCAQMTWFSKEFVKMVAYPEEVGIIDVTRWLTTRKSPQRRKILLLGSRAGALFRSPLFYTVCEWFNPHPFAHLVRARQFAHCYRVLQLANFAPARVQNFLQSSIASVPIGDGDMALAQLVQSGLFDVIVTMNVDTMVEQAFRTVGMDAQRDFQVFNLQQWLISEVKSVLAQPSCALVKVFGDVAGPMYPVDKRDMVVAQHSDLAKFLKSCFEEDVLIVGYDPHWDQAIGRLFPPTGGDVWYASEEPCAEDVFREVLIQRKGHCMVDAVGEYSAFLCSLHWYIQRARTTINDEQIEHIYGQLSGLDQIAAPDADFTTFSSVPDPPSVSPVSVAEAMPLAQVGLFYSEKDIHHLAQFVGFMKTYEDQKKIALWTESKIYAGDDLLKVYTAAVQKTHVAVVFISNAFLATDLLARDVFFLLLHAVEQRNVRIIPVYVDHCIPDELKIDTIKAFNDKENPLSDLKRGTEREKIFKKLAMQTVSLANHTVTAMHDISSEGKL